MKDINIRLKEIVGGGIASLGAGGLAGLAAYGGVTAFAAASTGTAIAGLSGAAATNATLAWFGLGSIASGGFGMSVGAVVLGGIVAGPILAAGGFMLASKAESAKHDAHSNYHKAELAVEEIKTAIVTTDGIRKKITELSNLLMELDNYFKPTLNFLRNLVNKSVDFKSYNPKEIKKLFSLFSLYETLFNLLNINLFTEEGKVTKEVSLSLDNSFELIEESMKISKKLV